MNPALPAFALVLCLAGAFAGVALVRTLPPGTRRLLDVDPDAAAPGRRVLAVVRERIGARFAPVVLGITGPRRAALIQHRLDAAGRPGGLTLEGWAGVKASATALSALAGLAVTLLTGNPIWVLALAAVGWLQVDLSLAREARRRQARIDRDLPDFLDVLTVTVGAGLGFRTALDRVAEALGGPLGEEFRIALRQMGYGEGRRGALEGVRDRNDSEALREFITALLQAEELGAPLGATLSDIARDMRKAFQQRARRDAARAAPRVSLIVSTVVVPGVIVFVLSALIIGTDFDLGVFGG